MTNIKINKSSKGSIYYLETKIDGNGRQVVIPEEKIEEVQEVFNKMVEVQNFLEMLYEN